MITIKAATFSDIPIIQQIVEQTWPAAYVHILGKAQVDYMIEKFYNTASLTAQMKNNHFFLLASEVAIPIGFAAFSAVDESIYKLQKLYVLPAKQKTGAGKALLQRVEEEVKNLGATKLQLNVNRENIAKAFYERNQFAVVGEEDIDIDKGYFMNDYIMEKDL